MDDSKENYLKEKNIVRSVKPRPTIDERIENQKKNDRKRALAREAIQKMTLFDNAMMRCVFRNRKDIVQMVIRHFVSLDLEIEALTEIESTGIEYYKKDNPNSRAVIFDILAKDKEGNWYNIELQNDNYAMTNKRMRYHSAMLDASLLMSGEKFKDIPNTYVIIFCKKDLYQKGDAYYILDRRIMGLSGSDYGNAKDGAHTIVVNGEYRGDDALGNLLRDMSECNPLKIKNEILRETMLFYKKEGAGLETFMQFSKIGGDGIYDLGVSDGKRIGIEEGRSSGIEEGKNMQKESLILTNFDKAKSIEDIASFLGESEESVVDILKKHGRI